MGKGYSDRRPHVRYIAVWAAWCALFAYSFWTYDYRVLSLVSGALAGLWTMLLVAVYAYRGNREEDVRGDREHG